MTMLRDKLLVGDARAELPKLEPSSIDMVLTSPPYFRLRDYAVDGQIGLEAAVDEWAGELAKIMRAARRLLTPTGSLWLNLGDVYATHPRQGAPRKSLLLGPERLALQLVSDGWVLRNKVIWQKPNPMPTSVRDRLTCTWEALYVFAPNPRYHFDLDGIRVPHASTGRMSHADGPAAPALDRWRGPNSGSAGGLAAMKARGIVGHPLGKNPGDVWRIASSAFRSPHHATFPVELAERAIRAGSPETRCSRCYAPWTRTLIRAQDGTAKRTEPRPTCNCETYGEPAIVLDMFFGAGTTGLAAERLRRDWLGIELNPTFAAIAQRRLEAARIARGAA